MSARSASHFGSTATSASHTPSTTDARTAAIVPAVTAESSAARPVLRRYAAAMATIRNISIPSRNVTSRTWPMRLRREDEFSVLRDAQPVFATVVRNDELALLAEEHLARDLRRRAGSGWQGRGRFVHAQDDNSSHYIRQSFSGSISHSLTAG